jgi:hypothetical protein
LGGLHWLTLPALEKGDAARPKKLCFPPHEEAQHRHGERAWRRHHGAQDGDTTPRHGQGVRQQATAEQARCTPFVDPHPWVRSARHGLDGRAGPFLSTLSLAHGVVSSPAPAAEGRPAGKLWALPAYARSPVSTQLTALSRAQARPSGGRRHAAPVPLDDAAAQCPYGSAPDAASASPPTNLRPLALFFERCGSRISFLFFLAPGARQRRKRMKRSSEDGGQVLYSDEGARGAMATAAFIVIHPSCSVFVSRFSFLRDLCCLHCGTFCRSRATRRCKRQQKCKRSPRRRPRTGFSSRQAPSATRA